MSINIGQLINYIIKPALKQIDLYSPEAEQLLVGTCAQESQLGTHLHQEDGPALGIFQMEPVTHDNIWKDFLFYKPDLTNAILSGHDKVACLVNAPIPIVADEMIFNLKYACQMARVRYFWIQEKLPEFGDIEGQAKYWAKYYNTIMTTTQVQKYLDSYEKYVKEYYK